MIDHTEAREALQFDPKPEMVREPDASVVTALMAGAQTVGITPLAKYLRTFGLIGPDVSDEDILRAGADLMDEMEPDAADEVDVKVVRQKLVEVLTSLKPTEVYTLHEEFDRHPGHRQAGKLVRESVGEAGLTPSGGVWAYEVWGPFARWDRLEYIDAYLEKKKLAIAEHRSQVATIPYGEGVIALNRWRAVFADPMAETPAGTHAEVFLRVAIGK